MSDDKSSQPWGHLHVALDHLNRPAKDLDKAEGLGWGYDSEKTKPELNGKANMPLDQEELETLTYLSAGERETTSIEKVLATMSGDMVGLAYRADFMRTSVAEKGRGRVSAEKIVGGSTPKISIPTTMQKVRRVFTGRGGKREEETEEGYEIGGDRS